MLQLCSGFRRVGAGKGPRVSDQQPYKAVIRLAPDLFIIYAQIVGVFDQVLLHHD